MIVILFFTLLQIVSSYYVCTDSITKVHYESYKIIHKYPTHKINSNENCTNSCGPCTIIVKTEVVQIGYTAWCTPNHYHRFLYDLKTTTKKEYFTPIPTQYGIYEDKPRHPFITHSYLCLMKPNEDEAYDDDKEDEEYDDEKDEKHTKHKKHTKRKHPIIHYKKRYSNERTRPLPTEVFQLPK